MNPNDFKRGIVPRHVRAVGDAPEIGRIGRMRKSTAGSGGQGRRRRSRSSGRRNTSHAWLSLVLGGIALVVLLAAVFLWLAPVVQRGKSKSGTSVSGQSRGESGIRVASRFSSPSKEEAVMRVESALANRDPALVEDFFRMGSASSSEVVAFCAGLEKSDGKLIGCQWLSSIDSPQAFLEGVVVNFQTADFTPHQRLALLTPDAGGRWQVDFEALARVVTPSWADILKSDGGSALVRVILTQDFYYIGAFQDESKWLSFGMSSPDLDFQLHGYCAKNSVEAQTASRLFADGSKVARAVLEIRHVEGGGDKQFEITRVLAQDWVLPMAKSPVDGLENRR